MERDKEKRTPNIKYERVNENGAMWLGRKINLKIIKNKYNRMILRLLRKMGQEVDLKRDERQKLN